MPSGQVTSCGGLFNIFSGTESFLFPTHPVTFSGILAAAIVAPIKYQRRNNNSRGW
jgi:hypothetical protein